MDFKHTNLSFNRSIGDYTKVQLVYGNIIRNKKRQINKIKNSDKKYLNVGCGPNIVDEFINLDYQWRPNLDLCWDVTKGLPLSDSSMKGIYTEHCLEHITFEQAQSVLDEFHRVMAPGGTVRVIVPDAELYLDLYAKSRKGIDVEFPYVTEADIKAGFSPIMSVNRVFRNHGHLYAYDFDCLSLMLKKAGFGKIAKESFRAGREKVLLVDSESRKIESVYVEASKAA